MNVDRGYESARVAVDDDEMMTERGTRVLVDSYANAPLRVERVAPADVRARRIGHFGFFRDAFEPTLWQRALDVVRGFIAGAQRSAPATTTREAA